MFANSDSFQQNQNALPAALYEALPGLYFLAAIATLWLPGVMIKSLSALLLLGACGAVLLVRQRARKLQKMSIYQARRDGSISSSGVTDIQSWPTTSCRSEQ